MELSTTSAAITFAKSLENDSLEVFERLAEQYPHWNALLAPLIRENKYNVQTIERAYIGVVSDALDTQFAFQGIDTHDYALATTLPDPLGEIVNVLMSNERTIVAFYKAAAESSRDLIADLPRAFDRIASKHERRFEPLRP